MASILGALCAMFVLINHSARRNGRPLQALMIFATLLGFVFGQMAAGAVILHDRTPLSATPDGALGLLLVTLLGLDLKAAAMGFGVAIIATLGIGWGMIHAAGPARPLAVRMPTEDELDR